jgi:hypothetical protein
LGSGIELRLFLADQDRPGSLTVFGKDANLDCATEAEVFDWGRLLGRRSAPEKIQAALRASGGPDLRKIAEQFGVNASTVRQISSGPRLAAMNEKKSTYRVEIKNIGTPLDEMFGWNIYRNQDVLPILRSQQLFVARAAALADANRLRLQLIDADALERARNPPANDDLSCEAPGPCESLQNSMMPRAICARQSGAPSSPTHPGASLPAFIGFEAALHGEHQLLHVEWARFPSRELADLFCPIGASYSSGIMAVRRHHS